MYDFDAMKAQIEAYLEGFDAATTEADRQELEVIKEKYAMVAIDTLFESYPGVIVRTKTQFAGTFWEPDIVNTYVGILYDLTKKANKTYAISQYNKWPLCLEDVSARIDSAEDQAFSKVMFERYIMSCFPYLSNRGINAIRKSVRVKYDNGDDNLVGYFSALARQEYAVCDDLDTKSEDIVTVFYPKNQYSEALIRNSFFPEYCKICHENRQREADWETAYAKWRHKIESRMEHKQTDKGE